MKFTADRSRISQLVAAEMSYFGSKYALPVVAGSTALVSMVALLFSLFFYIGQIGSEQNSLYLIVSVCALAAFFAAYAVFRMKASREGMQYDTVLIFTAECFLISGFAGLVILRTSWMWQLFEISPGQFNRYIKTVSLFAVIVPLVVAAMYAVFTFVDTDRPLPYTGWLYKVYTFVPFSVLPLVLIGSGESSETGSVNLVTVTSAIYISLILGFTVHFVAKLLMLKYLEETPARYETFIKVKHAKTATAQNPEVAPARVAPREDFVPSFTPDIEPETMREKVAAYADEAKANVEKVKSLKDLAGGLASGVAGLFGSKKGQKNENKKPVAPQPVEDIDDIEIAAAVSSLVEPELVAGSEVEAAAAEAAADAAAEPADDSAEREEQARLAAEAEELERREAEQKAAEAAREAEQKAAEAEELARIAEEAERDREAMLALEAAEHKRREELAAAPAEEHKAAAVEPEAAAVTPEDDEADIAPRRESGMTRLRNSIKSLFADLRTPLDGLYLEGGNEGGAEAAAVSPSVSDERKPEDYAEAELAELGGEFIMGTGIDGAQAVEKPAEVGDGEKPRVGQFFESHRKKVKSVPDDQLKDDYAAPAKKLAPKKPSFFERIFAFFKRAPRLETAVDSAAVASALERLKAMADEKARIDGLYESYARLARGETDKPAEEQTEPQTAEAEKSASVALERLTAMAREKEILDSAASQTTEAQTEPQTAEAEKSASVALERLTAMAREKEMLDSAASQTTEAPPEPHASALERLTAMAMDRAGEGTAESVEVSYQPVESGSALERLLAIKNRAERKCEEPTSPLPDSRENDAPHGLFETPFEDAEADYEPEPERGPEDAASALTEPHNTSADERESTDALIKEEASRGSEGALERLAAIAARRGVTTGETQPAAIAAEDETKISTNTEPEATAISKSDEPQAESAQETDPATATAPAEREVTEPITQPDIVEQLDETEPEPEKDSADTPPDEPLTEVMDDDFAKLRSYGDTRSEDKESGSALSEPEDEESADEGGPDGRGGESAKRAPIRAQVVRRNTVRPHSRRKPPHRH